jgi:Tfp pilus assembly protein PilZ
MELPIGNDPGSIKVSGKVAWKREGAGRNSLQGFGVQFKDLSPKNKEAI